MLARLAWGPGAKVGIEPVRGQIGRCAAGRPAALVCPGDPYERLSTGWPMPFVNLPIPVIGRISEGTLFFDLRTLDDEAAFIAQLDKLDVVAG